MLFKLIDPREPGLLPAFGCTRIFEVVDDRRGVSVALGLVVHRAPGFPGRVLFLRGVVAHDRDGLALLGVLLQKFCLTSVNHHLFLLVYDFVLDLLVYRRQNRAEIKLWFLRRGLLLCKPRPWVILDEGRNFTTAIVCDGEIGVKLEIFDAG